MKRGINIAKRLWKENEAIIPETLSRHSNNNKMPEISTHFSTIALNISGLELTIKRYRLVEWIKKQNISFCCLQETQI